MLQDAKTILAKLHQAGFSEAQVRLGESQTDELNIAHNDISLMRTTMGQSLSLLGIKDQRKVTASTTNIEQADALIASMLQDVASAPQDPAYGVARAQVGSFSSGPLTRDPQAVAQSAKALMAHRSEHYPNFQLEEASLAHVTAKTALVTTHGTELALQKGQYQVSIMGATKDAHGSSSFISSGGSSDVLPSQPAHCFDIDELMANSRHETQAQPLGRKFAGDVILMPAAVKDLLSWLLGQVSDGALLSGSSIYRERIGEQIAASQLTVRSHDLAASPFNGEGFLGQAVTLVDGGRLNCLLPSYYASRKLDLTHTPVSAGWQIDAGEVSRQAMVNGVANGALVGRLSMGSPASNGDFSGVIKNSFLLESGQRSQALSETMITGNVAQMLADIVAISQERTDFGRSCIPWLHIKGLKFS